MNKKHNSVLITIIKDLYEKGYQTDAIIPALKRQGYEKEKDILDAINEYKKHAPKIVKQKEETKPKEEELLNVDYYKDALNKKVNIETEYDKLLDLILKEKKITIEDVASRFNTTKENITEIAQSLENDKKIKIKYPLWPWQKEYLEATQ